jgi:hypothetical protein
MEHHTARIMSEFSQARINALAMKGAALRKALNLANPSKLSCDIDLLIQPGYLNQADRILKRLGYQCDAIGPNEASYVSPKHPPIDLHWNLIRWNEQSASFWTQMWDDRINIQMSKTEVFTLSPTYSVFALAMHAGCHHLCTDWASLHDIACCIKNSGSAVDWHCIIDLATKTGLKAALLPPIALVSSHFGARVPDFVIHSLRPSFHQHGLSIIALAGFNGRIRSQAHYKNAKRLWNLLSQPNPYSVCTLFVKWLKHYTAQNVEVS